MPIKIVNGDMLSSPGLDLIVNPVNTRGVMGAGLARKVKATYPMAFAEYRRYCRIGRLGPGDVLLTTGERLIAHAATKGDWRLPSSYAIVEECLITLDQLLNCLAVKTVGVPALGCGLGGLDWREVCDMMHSILDQPDKDIWLYKPRSG